MGDGIVLRSSDRGRGAVGSVSPSFVAVIGCGCDVRSQGRAAMEVAVKEYKVAKRITPFATSAAVAGWSPGSSTSVITTGKFEWVFDSGDGLALTFGRSPGR